jgi:hypothetical protein
MKKAVPSKASASRRRWRGAGGIGLFARELAYYR